MKKMCQYCMTMQPESELKRGEMFGTLLCKDRQACDQRKLKTQQ